MTLDEALDEYWNAAFAEGQRGATHDTEDARAQGALEAVLSCVRSAVAAERERWARIASAAQAVDRSRVGCCFVCGNPILPGETRAGPCSVGKTGSASVERHLRQFVQLHGGDRVATRILDSGYGNRLNTTWGHFSLTDGGWVADTDPHGSITLGCAGAPDIW